MFELNKRGGFIQMIIIVVIALIALGFSGFDVKNIIESPLVQENLDYVWGLVKIVWDDYLSEPILYFWHNIFLELFWDSFVDNIDRIKNGEPNDLQLNTPSV